MLCCGQCSWGYSVSGRFCYFRTFLSAYIQSDSKSTEAEKSCSHVAAEVSQGAVVCYGAVDLGNSYPSWQGRKTPLGISSAWCLVRAAEQCSNLETDIMAGLQKS